MTTRPLVAKLVLTRAPIRSSGEEGIETHGGALANVLRTSSAVAEVAVDVLQAGGLTLRKQSEGLVIPDWFLLSLNLRVLDEIGRRFGGEALFDIGASVPRHARFPPAISTLAQALRSLDAAYHMNHRCDGAVMYDPGTGRMLEGIGHYGSEDTLEGRTSGLSSSVYPCAFDFGLFSGIADRFATTARVHHGPDVPCRTRGDFNCVYVVTS